MNAFWSWALPVITTLIGLFAGSWFQATQTMRQLHANKEQEEFLVLRLKLEELCMLLAQMDAQFSAYTTALAMYRKRYLHDKVAAPGARVDVAMPATPEPAFQKMEMLIGFYAPQLKEKLTQLRQSYISFLVAVPEVLDPENTGTHQVELEYMEMYRIQLQLRSDIEDLYRDEQQRYLVPPTTSTLLRDRTTEIWNRCKSVLRV
jgi:hypothetical protein